MTEMTYRLWSCANAQFHAVRLQSNLDDCYQDQLQAGTLEHALHHLIDSKLNLSVFYPNYKNSDGGRRAYRSRHFIENFFVCLLKW